MRVLIKLATGKEFYLEDRDPTDTFTHLALAIQDREGISPLQIAMSYDGRDVTAHVSLAELEYEPDVPIEVYVKSKGHDAAREQVALARKLVGYFALLLVPILGATNALLARAGFISGVMSRAEEVVQFLVHYGKNSTIFHVLFNSSSNVTRPYNFYLKNVTNASASWNSPTTITTTTTTTTTVLPPFFFFPEGNNNSNGSLLWNGSSNCTLYFNFSTNSTDRNCSYNATGVSLSEYVPLHPLTAAIARLLISCSIFSVLYYRESTHKSRNRTLNSMESKSALMDGAASIMDHIWLCALGLIGITFNFIFFLIGVSLLPGVMVAGWMALTSSVVFLMASALGVESFGFAKLISMVLIVIGNTLLSHLWTIFTNSKVDGLAAASYETSAIGCVAMLLNILCFSYYIIAKRPLSKRFSVVHLTWTTQTIGLVGLLFIALIPEDNIVTDQLLSPIFDTGQKLEPISWISIAYSGLVQGVFVFYCLGFGLRYTGKNSPIMVSVWNNMQPVIVCVEAMYFLGERMDEYQQIGAATIALGALVAVKVSWMKEDADQPQLSRGQQQMLSRHIEMHRMHIDIEAVAD